MASRPDTELPPVEPVRGRCRCGHLPTDHMVVVPVGRTANYRLIATGPCARCGEAGCRKYSPGGS